MSSKKTALVLALCVLAPLASAAPVAGPTLQDLASLASAAKEAELRGRIEGAKPKAETTPPGIGAAVRAVGSAPAAAISSAAQVEDDIRLMAVYGMANRLRAEIMYNGRMVIVSRGVSEQVGPWVLREISPYKVTLAKEGGTKDSKRDVYMSGASSVELHARPIGDTSAAPSLPLFPAPGNMPITPFPTNPAAGR